MPKEGSGDEEDAKVASAPNLQADLNLKGILQGVRGKPQGEILAGGLNEGGTSIGAAGGVVGPEIDL